jgi:hypothetical protein
MLTDDHGRVRLVRAKIPFLTHTVGRQIVEGGRGSAYEHGRRRGRGVAPARKRSDRAAVRDPDREAPPRAVAWQRFPKWLAGQGKAVDLPAPIVERELDEREGVRRRRVEDEALFERSVADRPALCTEPAGVGDGAEVELPDGGLDGGAVRSGDLRSPC